MIELIDAKTKEPKDTLEVTEVLWINSQSWKWCNPSIFQKQSTMFFAFHIDSVQTNTSSWLKFFQLP